MSLLVKAKTNKKPSRKVNTLLCSTFCWTTDSCLCSRQLQILGLLVSWFYCFCCRIWAYLERASRAAALTSCRGVAVKIIDDVSSPDRPAKLGYKIKDQRHGQLQNLGQGISLLGQTNWIFSCICSAVYSWCSGAALTEPTASQRTHSNYPKHQVLWVFCILCGLGRREEPRRCLLPRLSGVGFCLTTGFWHGQEDKIPLKIKAMPYIKMRF